MEELEKKEKYKKEEYTCFHCNEAGSCPFAWNDYNLEGNCKELQVMSLWRQFDLNQLK